MTTETTPRTIPGVGDLNRLLAAIASEIGASTNRYCCADHSAQRAAIRTDLIELMNLHDHVLRLIRREAETDATLATMERDELATMRAALYASLLVERGYRYDLWYVADTGGYWTVARERGGIDEDWQSDDHYAAVAEAEHRNRRIEAAHRAVVARTRRAPDAADCEPF
jgi:hypothetical protein